MFAAAEQIRDLIGLRPRPMVRPFIDGLALTAEANLENQAARAAGRQLTPEAAIRMAGTILGEALAGFM